MKIFHYRRGLGEYRNGINGRLGFVPTMGALHSGHIALVEVAKKLCGYCAVSIFVNPRQFNNAGDLEKYPRTPGADLKKLQQAGADLVFIPEYGDLYHNEVVTHVDLKPLDSVLEGEFRPGHFKGVVEVLSQLFTAVRPTDVFFGQKDLQQCMVVEKLIAAEFHEITQHNCPTLREASGLAMSSRNVRLSETGLKNAASIYAELVNLSKDPVHFAANRDAAISHLTESEIETEYLEMVALPDMQKTETVSHNRTAIVYAGYLEGVRLIDNLILKSLFVF